MYCLVNSCDAGNGCVRAKVKGPTTQPPVMTTDNDCLAALSFVPLETGEHLLFVTYDDVNIPGNRRVSTADLHWWTKIFFLDLLFIV